MEGALSHLSPVQGLLGGRRNMRSDRVPGYMGEHPSVPSRSSSLPQVLSRGVGIIGGEGIGTPEWIEGALA